MGSRSTAPPAREPVHRRRRQHDRRAFGNQGKQLNPEFVQEVEVRTGGYEAEYGRALGGSVNVLTKSGGNDFHGDLFGYYDSGARRVRPARGRCGGRESTVPSRPRRLRPGIDLGGYFLKDTPVVLRRVRPGRERPGLPAGREPDVSRFTTASNYKSGTDTTRTNIFSAKLTFLPAASQTSRSRSSATPALTKAAATRRFPPGDLGPRPRVRPPHEPGGGRNGRYPEVGRRLRHAFPVQAAVRLPRGAELELERLPGHVLSFSTSGGPLQFLPGSAPERLEDETFRRNVYKAR